MTTRYIFFVSSNAKKLEEISTIIASDSTLKIELYDMKLTEKLSANLVDIVEEKALSAFSHVRHPLLVDHTSLCIDALGGLPGPASALLSGQLSNTFCQSIINTGNTKAEMHVGMGYTDGTVLLTATECKRGRISEIQRGSRLFDWDAIFIPDGDTRTYSQLSIHEKNLRSPRATAFRALLTKIENAK